jgi:hypothetical protein
MKTALVAASLAILGCGNDVQPAGADADQGTVDTAPPADAPETVTDVMADVTTDTTWSGLVRVKSSISIVGGVTLTVLPHTRIQIAAGDVINVAGTVNINGVKGGVVTIENLVANENWNAFTVSTGTLAMNYVVQTGGGFGISGSGHLSVRDSQFSHVTHDLLVVSAGTVDMQYSWIGVADGQPDTTHCDMHFEGGSPTITVSHSNISTSAYGVMLYAGTGVDFTYNNWFGNSADISETSGPPVTADLSNGWFKSGNPNLSGLTKNNMATAQVTTSGPR